jgi:hypothetical protein
MLGFWPWLLGASDEWIGVPVALPVLPGFVVPDPKLGKQCFLRSRLVPVVLRLFSQWRVTNMMSWLVSLFSGKGRQDSESICEVVRRGDLAKVRGLLDADKTLVSFARNQYSMTPLHVAAHDGQADIAELLISYGAKVDAKDRDASTPLFSASLQGHADLVGILLKAGANPCVVADEGVTPLHVAAMNGHLAVVKLLLGAGADPEARDGTGMRPTDMAEEPAVQTALKDACR